MKLTNQDNGKSKLLTKIIIDNNILDMYESKEKLIGLALKQDIDWVTKLFNQYKNSRVTK